MVRLGGTTSPTYSLVAFKNATIFLQQLVGLHLVQSRNCQKQTECILSLSNLCSLSSFLQSQRIHSSQSLSSSSHFHQPPALGVLSYHGFDSPLRHSLTLKVAIATVWCNKLRGGSFKRWWGRWSSALWTDCHKSSRIFIQTTDCLLSCHLAFTVRCYPTFQSPQNQEPDKLLFIISPVCGILIAEETNTAFPTSSLWKLTTPYQRTCYDRICPASV